MDRELHFSLHFIPPSEVDRFWYAQCQVDSLRDVGP